VFEFEVPIELPSLGILFGGLSLINNGDLKSLLLLWENLARNRRYETFVLDADIKTVRERVEHEGVTFLTTALPSIGKALDSYHSTNEWKYDHGHFRTDDQGIPNFLGIAIRRALGGNSLAVDCVRQLSYIFYKLELEFDDRTVADFLDQFVKTDAEIPLTFASSDSYRESILTFMRQMLQVILCNEDPKDIRPKHGSGATACKTAQWDKYHQLRYYPKLDYEFPYSDYFFYNFNHLIDEFELLEKSDDSIPRARVVLVPKDSRGPRIISCEPAELQYIQQGLMRKLYRIIEGHKLTSGQINFTDQTVNRVLARVASQRGDYATIDLKDASDRVSLEVIRSVFPPRWVDCLEACRSEETLLPDGRIVKLNKFAPMGSACCFPVEALVFWTCAQAAIHMQLASELRMRIRPRIHQLVYVYGDDIITPASTYSSVVRGLSSIGLVVNEQKSYHTGPFRESCGGDYHNAYDVTPVRVRKTLSDSSCTSITTNADLLNTFLDKFGEGVEFYGLLDIIENAQGYIFPKSELAIPGTIRTSFRASNDVFFLRRWNNSLQRAEHRILQLHSKVKTKHAPNWGELLRKELSRGIVDGVREIYEHWSAMTNSLLKPGEYVDVQSTKQKWTWVWLG